MALEARMGTVQVSRICLLLVTEDGVKAFSLTKAGELEFGDGWDGCA